MFELAPKLTNYTSVLCGDSNGGALESGTEA